ncbi:MAG: hypothetical protein R3C03_15325 [Pirellulaceae bacterium]
MILRISIGAWTLGLVFCIAQCLSANEANTLAASRHPVSIVEANIYVQKSKLVMNLKCFADDLELLQGVSPLADGSYDPAELIEATKDHADFLAERIELFNARGEKLEARIIEALAPEILKRGFIGDLMNLFCNFQI